MSDQGDHARPTLPRLEHGSVFAGYWIDRLLDRGGMGVVYKAMDIDLDRAVALKLIAPEWMEDENATTRFRTEARLAASLEHPNIVPVHRGGEEQGVLYLAMRFVPGTNLRRMIDRSPLPFETTGVDPDPDRRRARRRARARTGPPRRQAREHPDLRRDRAHARLPDRLRADQAPGSTGSLTGTGLWVGTADYVAPEQIQGHAIDGRADIYSLGCVLYEMLTGEVAYPKDGDIAKLWAHISNPPPQPSATRPDLVPAFDDVVAKATAKDPDDRYATAGEMADGGARGDRAAAAGAERRRPPRRSASPAPCRRTRRRPRRRRRRPRRPRRCRPHRARGRPPRLPPRPRRRPGPRCRRSRSPRTRRRSRGPAAPPPAGARRPPRAPPSRSASGGRSIAVIALVALGALAVAAVLLADLRAARTTTRRRRARRPSRRRRAARRQAQGHARAGSDQPRDRRRRHRHAPRRHDA